MFEENGQEVEDSTDDEDAKAELEKGESISLDEGEPGAQTQPLIQDQKRKQGEGEGDERSKRKQRPDTGKNCEGLPDNQEEGEPPKTVQQQNEPLHELTFMEGIKVNENRKRQLGEAKDDQSPVACDQKHLAKTQCQDGSHKREGQRAKDCVGEEEATDHDAEHRMLGGRFQSGQKDNQPNMSDQSGYQHTETQSEDNCIHVHSTT